MSYNQRRATWACLVLLCEKWHRCSLVLLRLKVEFFLLCLHKQENIYVRAYDSTDSDLS